MILLVFYRTCVFCGEEREDFTSEGLDTHYHRECPLLHLCKYCSQVHCIESWLYVLCIAPTCMYDTCTCMMMCIFYIRTYINVISMDMIRISWWYGVSMYWYVYIYMYASKMCDPPQVVELCSLTTHLLSQCAQQRRFQQCPRCKQAVLIEHYSSHTDTQRCVDVEEEGAGDIGRVCPLCYSKIAFGDKVRICLRDMYVHM